MYRLSDKESTHIIVKWSQPLAWLTLSAQSESEITDALVKRAYAAVSCRNPLLRAVYRPEVAKFTLIVRDASETIQDEADGKLPARLTREFHTRAEAWAEYERRVDVEFWESDFMWDVTVCALDNEAPTGPKYAVIAHFNHGVVDGAAVMKALSEFLDVLSAGLTASTPLPPHNFLGEGLPIPRPFLERYPLFKFDDPASDDEKEELFAKVNARIGSEGGRVRNAIVDKTFTEEATQRFIAKCKRNGVSVTAGLFAAAAIAAPAKKRFNAAMPLSYRSKDNWGDFAVSFTDAMFGLDLTQAWEENEKDGEDALWAAIAKEFHREIRKKFSSPEEMYGGMAISYLREALDGPTESGPSMCAGPNNDEFMICLSNVGILDEYFAGKEGGHPLSVEEVMAFCSNSIYLDLVFWCYTFRGKLRIGLLNATFSPRRKVFDEFAAKIIAFLE